VDADRFENLLRTLTDMPSRRDALRLVVGSALGLLGGMGVAADAPRVAARNCKKIKNKKRRKKCLAKACTPNCDRTICGDDGCGGSCGSCVAPAQCQGGRCVCVPNCTNRVCGSDGCTGSCGTGLCPATGQSCTAAGQCVCPTDAPDICGGACVAACGQTQARNPGTCDCCTANNQFCNPAANTCCSGFCFDSPGAFDTCVGKASGVPCDFDAQCASGDCRDSGPQVGTCA
jgi:hypothetical protein